MQPQCWKCAIDHGDGDDDQIMRSHLGLLWSYLGLFWCVLIASCTSGMILVGFVGHKCYSGPHAPAIRFEFMLFLYELEMINYVSIIELLFN